MHILLAEVLAEVALDDESPNQCLKFHERLSMLITKMCVVDVAEVLLEHCVSQAW